MKNFTLAILGNDFKKTTKFMEKIILNTKANTDQEHMKMNIIINNQLLLNEDELKNILTKLEKMNSSFLCLTFNDKKTYEFIKNNTNIPILNHQFSLDDDTLITNILNKFENEEE